MNGVPAPGGHTRADGTDEAVPGASFPAGPFAREGTSAPSWACVQRIAVWAGPLLLLAVVGSMELRLRGWGQAGAVLPVTVSSVWSIFVVLVTADAVTRRGLGAGPSAPRGRWRDVLGVAVLVTVAWGALPTFTTSISQPVGVVGMIVLGLGAWAGFLWWAGRRARGSQPDPARGPESAPRPAPQPRKVGLRLLLAVMLAGTAMPQAPAMNLLACLLAILVLGANAVMAPGEGVGRWTRDWGRLDVVAVAVSGFLAAAGVLVAAWSDTTWPREASAAGAEAGWGVSWTHTGGVPVIAAGVLAAAPMLWRAVVVGLHRLSRGTA